jgi:hypothetical protein
MVEVVLVGRYNGTRLIFKVREAGSSHLIKHVLSFPPIQTPIQALETQSEIRQKASGPLEPRFRLLLL